MKRAVKIAEYLELNGQLHMMKYYLIDIVKLRRRLMMCALINPHR